MKTKPKIAKLKVVKIDETKYWKPKFIKAAKKLFGVYIFDSKQETFCCELTPSCWLRFLYTFTEKHVSDKIWEEIRYADGVDDQSMYMHASDCAKMKVEKEYEFEYTTEEEYEEKFEEFMEYENCTPTVC